MAVSLKDAYDKVSRKVDTKGTQINAAETGRVISEFFLHLAKQKPEVTYALISKGLSTAKGKIARDKEKKKAAKATR